MQRSKADILEINVMLNSYYVNFKILIFQVIFNTISFSGKKENIHNLQNLFLKDGSWFMHLSSMKLIIKSLKLV